jgi:hypothetical protein
VSSRLLLAFAIAVPVEAQTTAPVKPSAGTRVRLESSSVVGRTVVGPLTVMNQGFVAVALDPSRAPASEISVPWSRVYDASVSDGEDIRRGFTRGMLIGLGAAVIVYPALTQGAEPTQSRGNAALVSFGFLPLTGAVIGSFNGPERWRPLLWRPTQDTVIENRELTRLRIAPETQVRVLAPGGWITARIVETTDDSLVVRRESKREAFDWESVTLMNMRARRNRARGGALGLTIMAVVTFAAASSAPEDKRTSARVFTRNLLAGAVAGALIGTPGWTRIPVPVR